MRIFVLNVIKALRIRAALSGTLQVNYRTSEELPFYVLRWIGHSSARCAELFRVASFAIKQTTGVWDGTEARYGRHRLHQLGRPDNHHKRRASSRDTRPAPRPFHRCGRVARDRRHCVLPRRPTRRTIRPPGGAGLGVQHHWSVVSVPGLLEWFADRLRRRGAMLRQAGRGGREATGGGLALGARMRW